MKGMSAMGKRRVSAKRAAQDSVLMDELFRGAATALSKPAKKQPAVPAPLPQERLKTEEGKPSHGTILCLVHP